MKKLHTSLTIIGAVICSLIFTLYTNNALSQNTQNMPSEKSNSIKCKGKMGGIDNICQLVAERGYMLYKNGDTILIKAKDFEIESQIDKTLFLKSTFLILYNICVLAKPEDLAYNMCTKSIDLNGYKLPDIKDPKIDDCIQSATAELNSCIDYLPYKELKEKYGKAAHSNLEQIENKYIYYRLNIPKK